MKGGDAYMFRRITEQRAVNAPQDMVMKVIHGVLLVVISVMANAPKVFGFNSIGGVRIQFNDTQL